jgi:F-type H+-transporting ATPase subunit a
VLCVTLFVACGATSQSATAAPESNVPDVSTTAKASDAEHGGTHGDTHGGGAHGEKKETKETFGAHAGTWLNPVARAIFPDAPVPHFHRENGVVVREEGEVHLDSAKSVKYDYIVVGFLVMGLLALTGTLAAKRARLRPEGKPNSLPNMMEAGVEGFRNYLVGVMGHDLAFKYTPLIASFFFCILLFNWVGLVPGMIAPTANPNTTIALALVAFAATHMIAIKEVGIKSYVMHYVGEPVWLFWLNIPLHLMGELVKPAALAIRLLCNVFGEEAVIAKLATMAVAAMGVLFLPIPFQFPIMVLGVLFGFLQALVFSTLLAIYISTMSTHHDDHDSHNDHGSRRA